MKRSRPNLRVVSLSPAVALLVVLAGGLRLTLAQQNPNVDVPASEPASEPAVEAVPTTESAPAAAEVKAGGKLEEDFSNYLHFALIGQFELADKYGEALLGRAELASPLSDEGAKELLALSEKYKNSIDTLVLMISNTPIAENAKKVLDLIRQAHARARMAPNRIIENIKLLAGSPMQQAVGQERLVESGEYAVPWMLDVLKDPQQADLHPFVVRTLPALGKRAVNPLVEALAMDNPAVQGAVAEGLGQIGYPQALPYLKRIAADAKANAAVREAAERAIARIVVPDPDIKQLPAVVLFQDLAEKYYANTDSLRPDSREERANVWSVKENVLTPVEVPREIYMYVMCMRAAEASLALGKDQSKVVALWLAADMRREAALGLDVTSEEAAQSNDLTRPAGFPRSIYFARTAGPMHCQLALSRAIHDLDPVVALGTISALHVTAGPATLVEPTSREGVGLAAALRFPDQLVRIRAALALGQALPQKTFREAGDVVPVLASALKLSGKKSYVVVDPDAAIRDQISGELTRGGATVVSDGKFKTALEAARKQFSSVDGVFLASDLDRPTTVEAIRELKLDDRFALAPVVLIVKANGNAVVDRVAQEDRRVGHVFVVEEGGQPNGQLAQRLLVRLAEAAPRFGSREIPEELGLQLALQAARTLHQIAVNRSPVYDIAGAEAALVAALANPSEELRTAAASALAQINSAAAQSAIAAVALSPDQTETLRKSAFSSLAGSFRRFGPKLEKPMMRALIEQATSEPNLPLRTAASQTLGATNLPAEPVADIILHQ